MPAILVMNLISILCTNNTANIKYVGHGPEKNPLNFCALAEVCALMSAIRSGTCTCLPYGMPLLIYHAHMLDRVCALNVLSRV